MLLVKALVLISKRLTLLSNSDVSKVSQIFIFLLGTGGKGPSGRRRSDEKRGCRRLMRGLKARPSAHSPGCKPWVSGPPSDEPCKGDSSMRASKGAALTGLIGRKSAPPRPCSLGYELKVSPSGLRAERMNRRKSGLLFDVSPSGLRAERMNRRKSGLLFDVSPSGLRAERMNGRKSRLLFDAGPSGLRAERMNGRKSGLLFDVSPSGLHVERMNGRKSRLKRLGAFGLPRGPHDRARLLEIEVRRARRSPQMSSPRTIPCATA